jgi:hypothetical protein
VTDFSIRVAAMSVFKPPLTLDQLREIQERNRQNEDVLALLWEIKGNYIHSSL